MPFSVRSFVLLLLSGCSMPNVSGVQKISDPANTADLNSASIADVIAGALVKAGNACTDKVSQEGEVCPVGYCVAGESRNASIQSSAIQFDIGVKDVLSFQNSASSASMCLSATYIPQKVSLRTDPVCVKPDLYLNLAGDVKNRLADLLAGAQPLCELSSCKTGADSENSTAVTLVLKNYENELAGRCKNEDVSQVCAKNGEAVCAIAVHRYHSFVDSSPGISGQIGIDPATHQCFGGISFNLGFDGPDAIQKDTALSCIPPKRLMQYRYFCNAVYQAAYDRKLLHADIPAECSGDEVPLAGLFATGNSGIPVSVPSAGGAPAWESDPDIQKVVTQIKDGR